MFESGGLLDPNLKSQLMQMVPPEIARDTKKVADFFHQQGFDARRREDFVKAVEYYSMSLMFNPKHFKAIFNRGI
jgi:hypothetical protein